MKVLHINYSSSSGGAAIAAHNLHSNLLTHSQIQSALFTVELLSSSPSVFEIKFKWFFNIKRKINGILSRLVAHALIGKSIGPLSLGVFPSCLAGWINKTDFDVVHLHWISGEMISIKDLKSINKPIVWTLHDYWPVQGVFNNYLSGANYSLLPTLLKWLEEKMLAQKLAFIEQKKVTLIAPSSIVHQRSKLEFACGKNKILTIPNLVGSEFYNICYDSRARERKNRNLSNECLLFVFVSDPYGTDDNKGFNRFIEFSKAVLKIFNSKPHFIVVGLAHSTVLSCRNMENLSHIEFQSIQTPTQMRSLYNAADFCVCMSYEETFGLTLVEAMLCGTAVVCSQAIGACDIIKNMSNGVIVQSMCPSTMAKSILNAISVGLHHDRLKIRSLATSWVNDALLVKKYEELYEAALCVEE